jgi:hypothetical protein
MIEEILGLPEELSSYLLKASEGKMDRVTIERRN